MCYIFSKKRDFRWDKDNKSCNINDFPVPRQLGTKLGQAGTERVLLERQYRIRCFSSELRQIYLVGRIPTLYDETLFFLNSDLSAVHFCHRAVELFQKLA